MALGNVSVGRVKALYAKEEATQGTLEYPTASDAIHIAGEVTIRQAPEWIEDPTRESSWSRNRRVFAGFNPGEASLVAFLAPISAGTAPRIGPLMKGLAGVETVNAGTDVQYKPHDIDGMIPTLSLAFRVGDFVYWVSGAVVNTARIPIEIRDLARAEFGIMFQKYVHGGPTKVKTDVSAGASDLNITTLDVNEPDQYEVGARFWVNVSTTIVSDPDNSGQGYKITDISGNTLTFTPAMTVLANQTLSAGTPVLPFLPDPTYSGDLVAWRLGGVTELISGGASASEIPITAGTIEFNNNVAFFWEKQTTDPNYPTVWRRGTREVNLELTMFMRDKEFGYIKGMKRGDEYEVVVPAGDTSGKIIEFKFPRAVVSDVEPSTGDEELTVVRRFAALAPSLDDEFVITFK